MRADEMPCKHQLKQHSGTLPCGRKARCSVACQQRLQAPHGPRPAPHLLPERRKRLVYLAALLVGCRQEGQHVCGRGHDACPMGTRKGAAWVGNTAAVVGNTLRWSQVQQATALPTNGSDCLAQRSLSDKLCNRCRRLTGNERCVGDGVGRHVWVAVRHCQQVLEIPLRFLQQQQQQQQQKCAVLRCRAWVQTVEMGCPHNSGSPQEEDHAGAPVHAQAAARKTSTVAGGTLAATADLQRSSSSLHRVQQARAAEECLCRNDRFSRS